MASIGVRAAIAHAAVDAAFRRTLLQDPAAACTSAGYDLSSDELTSLSEVIADDAFGVSFSAKANLPEMFQETSEIVDSAAPFLEERDDAFAV